MRHPGLGTDVIRSELSAIVSETGYWEKRQCRPPHLVRYGGDPELPSSYIRLVWAEMQKDR